LGFLSKEIAAQLQISIKTVETHKANAMSKMNLASRIDIVRYALLQGWLHDT
jgi:DNA-binding NarL/FixJ family response regulator